MIAVAEKSRRQGNSTRPGPVLYDQYASQFENGFNFVRFVFFVRGCKFGKKALGLDVTNDSLRDASCFLR
jgi:hypothetical protein